MKKIVIFSTLALWLITFLDSNAEIRINSNTQAINAVNRQNSNNQRIVVNERQMVSGHIVIENPIPARIDYNNGLPDDVTANETYVELTPQENISDDTEITETPEVWQPNGSIAANDHDYLADEEILTPNEDNIEEVPDEMPSQKVASPIDFGQVNILKKATPDKEEQITSDDAKPDPIINTPTVDTNSYVDENAVNAGETPVLISEGGCSINKTAATEQLGLSMLAVSLAIVLLMRRKQI